MKTKEERLQELNVFVRVNNRLPSKESKDSTEKSLGYWIHDNKKKFPEVQEIWGKYRNQKTSEERLQELKEFIKVNNRLPSGYSKDPFEKSLKRWIYKRGKKKYPEVQEIWDNYEHPKTPEERIQELKEFTEVNNRLPNLESKNSIERSLGQWMYNNKKMYPEIQEIWDNYEHPKTPEERLQELREFVEVNNKLPSQKSKDLTEKSLGLWMQIYKKKYPEIQEIWGNYEHPKKLEERFLEFREWVIKNNRLPSRKSKDPTERSLAIWMYNNKNWDILKQFIAIFKFKDEHPELWKLEISEA